MRIKIFFIIFPLLILSSCKKTVTEIETTTVTENIFICCLHSESSLAELISSPIADPLVSNVSIKWTANTRTFPFKTIEPGKVVFKDTSKLSHSITYTVQLTSTLGSAKGTITMPDSTSIRSPENGDTVQVGDSINITWASVNGVEFYEVYYQAWARNIVGDTLGELPCKYTYVSDTSFAIPDSFNISDTIFTISDTAWYSVAINVSPYAGPGIEPKTVPNMSGSVKGFLYAHGKDTNIECSYGAPQYKGESKIKYQESKCNHEFHKFIELYFSCNSSNSWLDL